MSFEKMAEVRDNLKFRGATKWVLMCIALREGKGGREAWPSIELIAKDAGVSKRTVNRVICSLEHMKVLKVTRRRNKTSKYTVDLSGCQGVSEQHAGGDRVAPLEVTECHPEYTSESTREKTPAVRTAEVIDMNAEETLKALEGGDNPLNDVAMVGKLNAMSQTVGNATRVWRRLMKTHHDAYTPEFTRKELGQFKLFIERAPGGRQLAIMGVAIKNWNLITLPRGASRLPKIGNLLTRIEEADLLLHNVIERSEPQPRQKLIFKKGIF
ncbi:hypothetical protein LCGC14_0504470 [marine sediment metagenome]|uniref:Helix-turn-helix domain-containing protein n=1 Tax=marine sediment metagenome TaxID=412755 RepID=A0A0F9SLC1_9ZZZZ